MADLLKDALIGAAAGLAGGTALQLTAQAMYDLTSAQNVAREQAIEPRNPFVVLAQKLEAASGVELTAQQEKIFEQTVLNGISAATGAAYAITARNWSLNWLAGGAVFGALFWMIEDEGIGPALGLAGDNTKYPLEAHARGLVAHVVFGVVTAGLLEAAGLDRRKQARRIN